MKRRSLLVGAGALACSAGGSGDGGSSGGDASSGHGEVDRTTGGSDSSTGSADTQVGAESSSTGGGGPDVPMLDPGIPSSVMRSSRVELDVELQVVDGAFPADLHGHYFMVCPLPWQDGTVLVNGDGMVFRLDFTESSSRVVSRLVRPPCFYAEKAVVGTDAAFTNPQGSPARMSPALGIRNQANTGLVPMGPGRLLVTYDAGRPIEIDAQTLETVTPVGYQSEWKPALETPPGLPVQIIGEVFPMVLSSAHPTWDPHTNELFLVNYGQGAIEVLGTSLLGETFTSLLRWTGQGALESYALVDGAGAPVAIEMSAHQMHVTERYVVLQDSSFRTETEKMFDAAAFTPQASQTTLWVVDRTHLATASSGGEVVARRVTLPRESPHFMVDYANPKGLLTVHLIHNNGYDASEWLIASDRQLSPDAPVRTDLHGMLAGPTDVNAIGRYVIDVAQQRVLPASVQLMQDDDHTWGLTLYTHRGTHSPDRHEVYFAISTGFTSELCLDRVAPSYAQHPHRNVSIADLPFEEGRPASLLRFEPDAGGIVDGYAFGPGRFISSPQFVPRPGAADDGDGYVVLTVVSDDTQTPGSSGDEFWVFDAADLAGGPLCRLGHPELNLPFTLHTTWLETLEPRQAAYAVDARTDLEPRMDGLSPELRALFETDVFPYIE